ncbi:MAG: DUF1090 domain-containing protein [Marinobacter sp.]|uniref:DUF1090 domain-containing protein n=1 Tax=Marinobacter sp. TaxID=50741 RepID=UPI003F9E6D3B
MFKTPTQLFSITTTAFAGLLFLLASASALASSDCSSLKGCERKFCEIETQLNIAKTMGNKHKEDGLRKALEGARKHCTDKGIREDLVEDIEEAKEDIVEYKADLKEAEEDGESDKIRKYQEKIEKQNSEIKRLDEELSDLPGRE